MSRAFSFIRSYGSRPLALASSFSGVQKASRYQRITMPGLNASASYCQMPGTLWQFTRTRH